MNDLVVGTFFAERRDRPGPTLKRFRWRSTQQQVGLLTRRARPINHGVRDIGDQAGLHGKRAGLRWWADSNRLPASAGICRQARRADVGYHRGRSAQQISGENEIEIGHLAQKPKWFWRSCAGQFVITGQLFIAGRSRSIRRILRYPVAFNRDTDGGEVNEIDRRRCRIRDTSIARPQQARTEHDGGASLPRRISRRAPPAGYALHDPPTPCGIARHALQD